MYFLSLVPLVSCSCLSLCVCWVVCEVQAEAKTEAATASLVQHSAPVLPEVKEDTVGFSFFFFLSSLLFIALHCSLCEMNPCTVCMFVCCIYVCIYVCISVYMCVWV
jgi:hypothetical protein